MQESDRRGLFVLAIFTTAFATRENPNIVLILTDDQGYGDASCYWPETDLKTPVMERIAAQGINLNQFRVNPMHTRPALSGLTASTTACRTVASEIGRINWKVYQVGYVLCMTTSACCPSFEAEGYATGLFGKWHLGYDEDNVPNARGFDEFVGFLEEPIRIAGRKIHGLNAMASH